MNYKITDFTRLEKISDGTYSVVYKCMNNVTNELTAIKNSKSKHDEDGIPYTTLREISILLRLIHPNIVHLQQTIITNVEQYMIFEYLNTDLRKYLNKNTMNSNLVKRFAYQMMQGLLFCHTKGIMHRDLKPQNLLIDTEKMILKIADFGSARTFGVPIRQLTHEVVTLWYRSPEIIMNTERYSCAIDVWSVGCIIPEMITGEPIFTGDTEISQLFAIFKILGTPNNEIWPKLENLSGWNNMFPVWNFNLKNYLGDKVENSLLDLLTKMLTYYPVRRINVRDALLHEYFNDLDKSDFPAHEIEKLTFPSYAQKFYKIAKSNLCLNEDSH